MNEKNKNYSSGSGFLEVKLFGLIGIAWTLELLPLSV